MIIFQIQGGLGNQLFQIFCGLNYELIHNKEVFFTSINRSKHRGVYWNTFFTQLKDKLKNEGLELYKEPFYQYKEIPIFDNKIIFGFFQSDKYFRENFNKIYNFLNIDNLKNQIKHNYNFSNSCSIHFRIGDYDNKNFPILSLDYYQKAINYIENKIDNFYIFYEKNDEKKILDNLNKLNFKTNYILINTDYKDYEQLLLMSLCENNIIANSTFS